MPELKNYRIFISHSWDYNEHYEKVKEWLNNSTYFKWSNYSVPFSNPIETSSKEELKEKIENKISLCNCIIILSGMYVSYSEWIDFEIEAAGKLSKPIIGVKPWGNEKIPSEVSLWSDTVVGWNSSSVVKAVREYAL